MDSLLRFSPFQHSSHVFSVGELAARIGQVLAADPTLEDVWLRGEVVNVNRSAAGHYYFSLKEDLAQLRCVLFRGSAFNSAVVPVNGLAVVVHGAIELYERQGSCQLIADLVFPEGVGLAHLHGERVYRQLEAEGLFEVSRKRPLPRFPRRVGIISSERGAVIHDLLSVLQRRFPLLEVVFIPTPVQGPGAAAALTQALGRLGRWQRDGARVDAIVLARGGGSEDDLSAFNDERLARAIFASPVPVVSAVGHETNLTLSDLVADLRAATPSAAAELVAPDLAALLADARALRQRGEYALRRQLAERQELTRDAGRRLERHLQQQVRGVREQIERQASRLRVLSPRATLSRGYAIVESAANGHVLHDSTSVEPGHTLRIQLHRGRLVSTVDASEPEA